MSAAQYNEDSVKSLDWKDHIRLRPGMYIGKLGDGASPDDGIYVLIFDKLFFGRLRRWFIALEPPDKQ